jgi:hypothetical protein
VELEADFCGDVSVTRMARTWQRQGIGGGAGLELELELGMGRLR